MAALAHQPIAFTGSAVSFQAAESLDTATADRRSFLWVRNGGGSPINVTITVPGTTFGQNNPDIVVAVPNGAERMIGPLSPDLTAAETFGVVLVTYSALTSVTVAVARLGDPAPPLP